jgi:hypothetical protein
MRILIIAEYLSKKVKSSVLVIIERLLKVVRCQFNHFLSLLNYTRALGYTEQLFSHQILDIASSTHD